MAKSNNWTREETIVAFNVYCKIPFKSSSKSNPTVIKYANILGRSPSALNMKIGNFGRLDPELKKQGITGLVNGSKLEEDIWDEFNGNWEKLAFESEELIARFQNKKVEEIEEQISGIQNDLSGVKKGDVAPPTGTNPIYDEWVAENKWYLENDEMAQYADTVAKEYEGAPAARLFNLVTKKVKEVFPEAFEVTPQVKEPIGGKKPIGPKSPVEGGNNSAKGASNFTKADLSPDQLQIMKQFVQGGIMTEQQYINDIAKMQEA